MNPTSLLGDEFRMLPHHKKALEKMGLGTVEDLLYHFPTRYGDTSQVKNVAALTYGENAVVFGKISKLKTSKAFIKKIPMSEGTVTDATGHIKCVWFNQPYIAKIIHENQFVRIEGKVSERKGQRYMSNPRVESVHKLPEAVGDSLFGEKGEEHHLYPIYPESKGVTSNWIYHIIQKIMAGGTLTTLVDPIPEEILKKYNLPGIKTAFIWIHTPKKEADAESARKRFAFQEIFFIQLQKQKERKLWNEKSPFL